MSLLLAVALLAAPQAEVVLVQDARAPIVELRLEVPVGTWSPWFRRVSGEAAWEALLLDPERALLRRADGLALEVDTSVGSRACTLRAAFLREDLPEVVQLLQDALADHPYDRRELKRRARSRALSWRLSMKDPSYVLERASVFLLFPEGDPRRLAYEKPRGSVPSQRSIREVQTALLALPGRVLGVAGDVDQETAESLARRLFPAVAPAVPEGVAAEAGPAVTPARRKDVTETIAGLTQVYLADVRTGVPVQDEDAAAFAIADHVLGGHFYSRLSVALRHEGGETYGAWTRGARDTVASVYTASTFTRTGNAAVAERKLTGVLRTFHEDGITEEERAGAVGFLRGRLAFSRQSPAQVLERALFERRLGLAPGSLDALVDRAEATALEDVNAFIRRFYDPASFRRVRVR